MSGRGWLTAVLAATVFASALGLVYVKYENRRLFNQHQQLVRERDRIQVEWGQLRLELSALVMHGRIERLARDRLDMRTPDPSDVVVIRHE